MQITRQEVVALIEAQGFLPLYFHPDASSNFEIAMACHEGGSRLLEFTNRGEGALVLFDQLVKECAARLPELVVGAGSIIDRKMAAAFIDAGATFIVAPIFNEEVAALCNDREVCYIPGCATLTEILRAEQHGAELIKLFPASALGGPAFIKAVRGPCPWLKLIPTGGVSTEPEELREWFDGGAVAVGLGSNLISTSQVQTGDYAGISSAVAAVRIAIDAVRPRATHS